MGLVSGLNEPSASRTIIKRVGVKRKPLQKTAPECSLRTRVVSALPERL